MLCIKILFLVCPFTLVLGYPTETENDGFQELTPEQSKRLDEWTEDSKENIWALSGQFQGDMILSPEQRNGKFDQRYRWPNNTVIYALGPGFTQAQKGDIVDAITEITQVTCIKIRYVTSEPSYVLIRKVPKGCSSDVGFQGAPRQHMNLQVPGCLRSGTIQHEFLHTLGFHHMQSDSERDDYVEIRKENIKVGFERNFRKYTSSEVTKFGEEYDYGSIMHYGEYDFSKNGQPTIVPTKDPTAVIGQRWGLSQSDINKVNNMYNCP